MLAHHSGEAVCPSSTKLTDRLHLGWEVPHLQTYVTMNIFGCVFGTKKIQLGMCSVARMLSRSTISWNPKISSNIGRKGLKSSFVSQVGARVGTKKSSDVSSGVSSCPQALDFRSERWSSSSLGRRSAFDTAHLTPLDLAESRRQKIQKNNYFSQ